MNRKKFRKVLFDGEGHPKINIICDTLHEGLRAELRDYQNKYKKNIVLMNCSGISKIDFDRNPVEVYSPYVPYGVVITMNFESGNINYQYYDEIIYMQPYPFTLDNVNRKLDNMDRLSDIVLNKKYKIMFYRDVNQHSGEGDLVGIDQALKEAPERIKSTFSNTVIAKSIEFCVYKTPMDFVRILHGGCGKLSMSLLSCIERYKKFSDKLAYFKGELGDYKFILEEHRELTDETKINSLTKFDKVKGCSNIIERYTDNYMKEFALDIERFIDEVYRETVKDICFWNLKTDMDSLKSGAKEYIKLELRSTAGRKEKCPATEAEYNNIIRIQYALDTKFESKVQSMINNGLMNYMYDYLKRKEELLSGAFLTDLDIN